MTAKFYRERVITVADEGGGMTLEAVGRELGLTRERIRQIESRALGKLAAALAARGIRAEDLLRDHPPAIGMIVRKSRLSQ